MGETRRVTVQAMWWTIDLDAWCEEFGLETRGEAHADAVTYLSKVAEQAVTDLVHRLKVGPKA